MASALNPRHLPLRLALRPRLPFLPSTSTTTTTTTTTPSSCLPIPSSIRLPPRRHKSGPYGYTLAKTLVFSRFGEPRDVLSLHTHSISPALPDGAALLRALAAPVNPADVNTVQGTYGAKPAFERLLGTPEPAAVPGNEGCFESGFGTFRTHALVEGAERKLIRVGGEKGREGLRAAQVATVSVNPCSAYRMLRDYVDLVDLSVQSFARGEGATGGAWFVQNGANSGVGRAAIQLGRLWGLRSINVVRERATPEETAALKRELAELGATVVVTESEFLDRSFADRLRDEWTRGGREPVMLGLNCVGGKSAAAMVKALSPRGCMVTYGGMSRQSFPFPTGQQIFKRLRFEGFWLSEWAKENPAAKRDTINEILELMREGKFKEAPLQEVEWNWDTEESVLKDTIQGTLEGFRPGKSIFVFKDT
ncbi:6020fdb8-17ec-4d5f-82b9-e0864976788f [Thermothielavioides terrestris]|uniref:6020fdb8-17ec-4d5f-82b9-e0864976788f n=1 Tax=Thermothielavioides terrestris TaxID=2587410 RepID=A0A3S4D128_9PEZI|nr:6020fdb8-17ec-4d5f-82b9-e0864976788f [Thermothielavioides terrestris]